jgi:hypothetical protein
MEFKNGQVKILANKHTGREQYVDLQDIVLNPGSSEEITLGKFLNNLSNENEANKKEVEKANARKEIAELKQLLKDTDFKAIKYFEGYYTDEEYEPIKLERQSYRDKINALEVLLNEE